MKPTTPSTDNQQTVVGSSAPKEITPKRMTSIQNIQRMDEWSAKCEVLANNPTAKFLIKSEIYFGDAA